MPRIDFRLPGAASAFGAAYMVASDIRYVQECAMANRVSKSVTFASGQTPLYIPRYRPLRIVWIPLGSPSIWGNNYNTSTNPYVVTFNSLGEPIVGGAGWVEVTGGGQTKRITVENYTGKVSIP